MTSIDNTNKKPKLSDESDGIADKKKLLEEAIVPWENAKEELANAEREAPTDSEREEWENLKLEYFESITGPDGEADMEKVYTPHSVNNPLSNKFFISGVKISSNVKAVKKAKEKVKEFAAPVDKLKMQIANLENRNKKPKLSEESEVIADKKELLEEAASEAKEDHLDVTMQVFHKILGHKLFGADEPTENTDEIITDENGEPDEGLMFFAKHWEYLQEFIESGKYYYYKTMKVKKEEETPTVKEEAVAPTVTKETAAPAVKEEMVNENESD